MSFKAQKWAWDQKTRSPLSQLLLFTIAQLENDELGFAWASHSYLADKCRCKRRAIIDNLNYLEDQGYITVERQDGFKQTNHYRVNYDRCALNAQRDTDVQQMHSRCAADAHPENQEPEKNQELIPTDRCALNAPKHVTISNNNKNRLPAGKNDFQVWYQAYPRKMARKNAEKAWDKAKDKPPLQIMLDKLELQKASEDWLKDDGDYIPYPATYLNQGQWDNDVRAPKLTELQEYELEQRRAEAILRSIDGTTVEHNGKALPSPMAEDQWADAFRCIPELV